MGAREFAGEAGRGADICVRERARDGTRRVSAARSFVEKYRSLRAPGPPSVGRRLCRKKGGHRSARSGGTRDA